MPLIINIPGNLLDRTNNETLSMSVSFITTTIAAPTTANLTARKIFLMPLMHISDEVFILIASILTFIWIVGSFLNGICLMLFLRNRHLHTPSNMLIIGLNICDFLSCFIATPPSMISAWNKRWVWGHTGCTLEGMFVYFLTVTSINILMAIACFRYIAIMKPNLNTKITKRTSFKACVMCYLLGFLWAILPVLGWNEFGLSGGGFTCNVLYKRRNFLYKSYILAVMIFCLVVPTSVMLFAYCSIIGKLHRLNRNMKKWNEIKGTPGSNLVTENQIFKTAGLIMIGFIVCWMPSFALTVAFLAGGNKKLLPQTVYAFPPVFSKCQGLINPMIYVATNKIMKRSIYHMVPNKTLRQYFIGQDTEYAQTEATTRQNQPEDDNKLYNISAMPENNVNDQMSSATQQELEDIIQRRMTNC